MIIIVIRLHRTENTHTIVYYIISRPIKFQLQLAHIVSVDYPIAEWAKKHKNISYRKIGEALSA